MLISMSSRKKKDVREWLGFKEDGSEFPLIIYFVREK